MGRKFFLLALIFLLPHTVALAQTGEQKEEPGIFAMREDLQGERLEGYFLLPPEEITVATQDGKEETVPSKYLKSIVVEEIKDQSLIADPKQEATYSVRLENGQKIYTFRKKYTLSLNASLGLVTKSVDPATISNLFSKGSSQTQTMRSGKEESLIQGETIFFGLELKF
jgi:hypothetical protein